ncbi:MAG: GspE/PulE family protein [bacterium]
MSDFPSINSLLEKVEKDQNQDEQVSDKRESATNKFYEKKQEMDIKSKEDQVSEKAMRLSLPHIDLSSFPVSNEALRLVPEQTAKEKKYICFFHTPEELRLGCVGYGKEIEEIAFQMGERYHANTIIYLISQHSLDKVLILYKNLPVIKPITKDINITDQDLAKYQSKVTDFRDLSEQFKNVSITDILTLIIAAALKVEASDVHVEAEEDDVVVRYRIDGVLHDVAELPRVQWKKFVSRIKLLAALKINITDRPQDGRVTLKLSKESLDIRVSTMPTVYGESVVMRILYSGVKQVEFDDLGLRGFAYKKLKKEVLRTNGMIITTGPTGSGKTTTMYSILRILNKPGVKIITMEDPVEIKMEGINQSQVDPDKGYTFAKGLRSLLRQDPDICMVGEIRDLETANIAIQAALTGHLMLSTIHTNSASGAIPRFLSMGVQSYSLAPALNSVIGQRLVRKICKHCQEEIELNIDQKESVKKVFDSLPEQEKAGLDMNNLHFYHGKGCEKCSGLGYKGRVGIYEIFIMSKEIKNAILSNQVTEYSIEDLAIKDGMTTMLQDGLLKALDKITSVDEVFRVAG